MTEHDVTFESFEDWRGWYEARSFVFDADWTASIANRVVDRGLVEPLTHREVRPPDISNAGGNWREGLIYRGVNSRGRAVMRSIETTFAATGLFGLRIYAPEAVTQFALRLRGLCPKFLGSEYTDDPQCRENLYPIPFQDLMSLTLPSNTFDLVSTNEVLEHVPDLDAALREVQRVLRPGGWHVGTCPFLFMGQDSLVRARLVDGKVEHLTEPEYHGNPVSAEGSLVFELPGWDILQRCRTAGFSYAAMRFMISETYGCLSPDCSGIFVLICRK